MMMSSMAKPQLKDLPDRTRKPRESGITMVIERGLGVQALEDLLQVHGEYIDLIKLGFGTAYLTPEPILKEKIRLIQSATIEVFFGGTLWEAFFVREQMDDYLRWIDRLGLQTVEISDGSIALAHEEKCRWIERFARSYRVLSEVGYKDQRSLPTSAEWVERIQAELQAGAWKVVCEARESGTTGIFTREGTPRSDVVEAIVQACPVESVIWEAPQKHQQVWFLRRLGPNVNLGNIPLADVLSVEALRQGLRGDTFFAFFTPARQEWMP